MIVMTTGLTGLMALMRQDEKPKDRASNDACQSSSLRPSTTTSCRSKPSR
jgi:hypothetical protein